MDLSKEASLLPHLVAPLILNAPIRIDDISMMIPQPEALRQIETRQSLPKAVRLAALLISWAHINGDIIATNDENAILSLWTPDTLHWFLPSFAACIEKLGLDARVARRFVNVVLRAVRAEYDARELLDPLLERWRETSTAPVTNANVMERWLSS